MSREGNSDTGACPHGHAHSAAGVNGTKRGCELRQTRCAAGAQHYSLDRLEPFSNARRSPVFRRSGVGLVEAWHAPVLSRTVDLLQMSRLQTLRCVLRKLRDVPNLAPFLDGGHWVGGGTGHNCNRCQQKQLIGKTRDIMQLMYVYPSKEENEGCTFLSHKDHRRERFSSTDVSFSNAFPVSSHCL